MNAEQMVDAKSDRTKERTLNALFIFVKIPSILNRNCKLLLFQNGAKEKYRDRERKKSTIYGECEYTQCMANVIFRAGLRQKHSFNLKLFAQFRRVWVCIFVRIHTHTAFVQTPAFKHSLSNLNTNDFSTLPQQKSNSR